MAEQLLSGGCHCGEVRYEARCDAAVDAVYCHCRDCFKTSGATPVAWVCLAHDNFQVVKGQLKVYQSSEHAKRQFCANCGCLVLFYDQRFPDDVDLTLATLDDPKGIAPRCHIWTGSAPAWSRIDKGLPQFAAGRGSSGDDIA